MHDLEQIEHSVWAGLERATTQPDHDWRLPVLGCGTTVGWDLRTVVLREVNREFRTLTCHSDARAPKIAAIKRDSMVRWLFYDRRQRIQVKVEATATVHTSDGFADQQWAKTALSSRRAYLAPAPPGLRSADATANLPSEFRDRFPTEEEVAAGRVNFAAIVAGVISVEWLGLFRSGNLRALFDYQGDVKSRMWLTP